jgi:hypothetical protein
LDIGKATLVVKPVSFGLMEGRLIPKLEYTLTGFVNGDTAASAVTGAPVLKTTATSRSLPGNYPITATQGTLASRNYAFTVVTGTLTIVPRDPHSPVVLALPSSSPAGLR